MSTPREQEASEYLQNHQIIQMINNLTSMLFFHRPEQPKEYLIELLEQLQASKIQATDSMCLFNDSDLDAVFGILDLTKEGHISYTQYTVGLETLGIQTFNEEPEGFESNRISCKTFKEEAKAGLLKIAATYQMQ